MLLPTITTCPLNRKQNQTEKTKRDRLAVQVDTKMREKRRYNETSDDERKMLANFAYTSSLTKTTIASLCKIQTKSR